LLGAALPWANGAYFETRSKPSQPESRAQQGSIMYGISASETVKKARQLLWPKV